MSAYSQIIIQLRRFVRKYFLNELIKGIILFLVFGFLYFLITALVEYFFWLPSGTRKYLFYGQWLAILIFFLLFLAKPILNLLGLKQDLSDEQAAMVIGKFFPEIQDKLLNTIQLKKSGLNSELLVAGIEQKAAQLQAFRFSKAINFKQNYKYLPVLLLPFLILLGLRLTHFDKDLKQSYERVLSYRQEFTPHLPYSFQLPDSLKVVAGKDYVLQVKISGEALPENLFLQLPNDVLLLQKQNDTLFSFTFPAVQQDVAFSLSDGKHTLGHFALKTIQPPLVTNMQIRLIYPAYLHQKPKLVKQLMDLTVPQSTRIVWALETQNTDAIRFGINNNVKTYRITENSFQKDTIAENNFTYHISPSNQFLSQYVHYAYQVQVIKDQMPQIKILTKKDSIQAQNFHRITASDDYGIRKLQLVYQDQQTHQKLKKIININPGDFIQTFYAFPGDLNLEKGHAYSYYFQAFDNDAPHGYKSVKSQLFYYNKLTNKQLEKQLLKQQESQLQELSKLKEQTEQQKQQLDKISHKITNQNQMDWQTKKMLEQSIQSAKQQEEFFKRSIQKFKDILKKLPDDKKSETKKDLEKRLQELAEMQKKKKLMDELKKLAEKLKKEDLLKKLKDLSNYSEHQEKSLERILELTKKYYLQQKLQKVSEKLNDLARKQDSLSGLNSDKSIDQKQLNKQLDSLQKQTDSLQQLNKSLQKPMQIPDTQTDMQDIKQDMQKAQEQLSQNQTQPANQTQKKAANKMKQLAKQMSAMAMSGGGEQHEEDIKTLQAILKSLLNFSFKEEQFLTDMFVNNSHKYLSKQLIGQHNLKSYFKHINDSLYTLALRNPKISQMILDEAFNIEQSLDKSLNHLSENQLYQTQSDAKYVLKSSNKLADFLSNALDQMKNAMPSMGQGQGKKGKGKSFSLPDIIKKQGEALSKARDGLKKKSGQGKQGKKDGKQKGNQGKNGKNKSTGSEGEAQRQYELYKMQQQVKEDLNQLGDKFSDKATRQRIKDLTRKMDELQKKILKEGINERTVQKMIALQHELLKLKNAVFTQHEDNKRQSRTNYRNYNGIDSLFLHENFQKRNQKELLQRHQLPVNQEIKQKILQYLNEYL